MYVGMYACMSVVHVCRSCMYVCMSVVHVCLSCMYVRTYVHTYVCMYGTWHGRNYHTTNNDNVRVIS